MEMFNPSDTNEGARLLKLWLQFAQSKRLGERVVSDVERGIPDSPFEEHVIAAVESLGFEAVPQVGVSNYYIDIGVKHPDYPFGYICGVECDGATYHSSKNARDRDRLREEVLLRLGWDLYRIWSTDWFRDPYGERQNLENYLQACLRDKVAGMPEVVESPVFTTEEMSGLEEGAARPVPQEQEASQLFSDTDQKEAVSEDADTVERIGPIAIGSRVRVRYLDGARAGVETRFWLTDLAEDQYAEMPGYRALRAKAPIFKAIVGGYEGDLVSYDFQDTEIGVEILEVIT
jgi:very-short-patch-repair endonuclease